MAAPHSDDSPALRRTRILDAAERRFARSGFQRTTVNDVAAEAGMSPGNLYRYFDSKDAIVGALVERCRAEVAADFAQLDSADDLLAAIDLLFRRHFAETTLDRALLCLEICTESARNRILGDSRQHFVDFARTRLTALFERAQRRGLVATHFDAASLAVAVLTIADGLLVRRTILADAAFERELDVVAKLVRVLLTDTAAAVAPALPAAAE